MSNMLSQTSHVIPAHLSFLAIFNPSLAKRDDLLKEQIVFYHTAERRARRGRKNESAGNHEAEREEENEQLRQVGLAQGMVDFAKNFSGGKSVDAVETEKSRLVLREVEKGWWILASVDLNRLPSSRVTGQDGALYQGVPEYSSREVLPPQLMLQYLLRAHSTFLLHHAATLDDLYSRLPRPSFCTLLHRFWTRFIFNWDVLLHGNPAVDIYNGIKLAGGGELGIGVGEEEWGSGEREVLEDFIARTEGLVDLVVSRFGDAPEESPKAVAGQESSLLLRRHQAPWLGADLDPGPSDGVLFSGIGAISRRSVATVSHWMADIYKFGEEAYGVAENPTARPRRKKQRLSPRLPQRAQSTEAQNSVKRVKSPSRSRSLLPTRSTSKLKDLMPGIPPPLVKVEERSASHATTKASSEEATRGSNGNQGDKSAEKQDLPLFGADTMMRYLSLGYGSSWTLNTRGLSQSEPQPRSRAGSRSRSRPQEKSQEQGYDSAVPENTLSPQLEAVEPTPVANDREFDRYGQRLEQSTGKFLIGLTGDLENEEMMDHSTNDGPRIVLRTLTVGLPQPLSSLRRQDWIQPAPSVLTPGLSSHEFEPEQAHPTNISKQLQVAVYIHKPFIFTFLFELHTPSLTYPSFYRNIHHQLGPLQKPLLRSTDPANVATRIAAALGEGTTTTTVASPGRSAVPPIYDLIYDPEKQTIHGSLPNIPPPGSLAAEGTTSQAVSGKWYTLGIPTSSSSSPSSAGNNPRTQGRRSWTRIEALHVHNQILNTHIVTRRLTGELERTVKTGRGWWVLWMRVQGSVNDDADDTENRGLPKEAILVRKSREDGSGGGAGSGPFAKMGGRHGTSSTAGGIAWLAREPRRDVSGSSTTSGAGVGMAGVSSVSEGVGVDARRWVEGLLSLHR